MNEKLLLSNQLCFLFYQIDREIISGYRPFLKELDLTYPQYLVMLVLWEEDQATVGRLCSRLFLDSGTISPLLKRLEKAGFIERKRDSDDERIVNITLTKKGRALEKQALSVPESLVSCINIDPSEIPSLREQMKELLDKIRSGSCSVK